MKKAFSLDYSIETDVERMEAIKDILDKLPTTPSSSDLELMASYVLYGKDENGQNAVQRGETDDRDSKRYNTFRKADEKVVSFDAWLEEPGAEETSIKEYNAKRIYPMKKRTIQRPKVLKDGTIDPGDSDIPGMVELWEAIDHLEHTLAANRGEVEFNVDDIVITDPYRLWQLSHIIVDVRRHQYYLKDYYKPTLHFNAVIHPQTPTYNWEGDTFYWISREEWERRISHNYFSYISNNIEDYETRENSKTGKQEIKWVVRHHHFDWENPYHIKCLILHYSELYMQLWDKVDSWGRTLIYDLDRYVDLCNFTDVRMYILIRKIDRATNNEILHEVHEKFGIKYNEGTIGTIINKEIPETIANYVKRERLLRETPQSLCKKCPRCGRVLPAMPPFFGRNKTKVMGVNSSCKECERKRRIELRGLKDYDSRSKDTQMRKVQTGKTRI